MIRTLAVLDARDAVVEAATRLAEIGTVDRIFWDAFGLLRDRLARLAEIEGGSTEIPGLDEVTAAAAARIAGGEFVTEYRGGHTTRYPDGGAS